MSKIPEIDSIDSLVIAKHILASLNLPIDPKDERLAKISILEETEKVLREIEKIEESWEFKPSSNNHTYGRKEKGEVIKLWSIPRKSAEVLRNLVILTKAQNILEIGTSAGYSTLFLSDGAQKNNGRITTIELLKEKADLARHFFKQAKINNIHLVETEASQLLKQWKLGTIDLVFLDADKENYGKYLDLLLPHMKAGALIVADNINDYGHMMEDYLQRITGTHLPKSRVDRRVKSYYLAALDNGLMITKKL